jgi:hypothetical protein
VVLWEFIDGYCWNMGLHGVIGVFRCSFIVVTILAIKFICTGIFIVLPHVVKIEWILFFTVFRIFCVSILFIRVLDFIELTNADSPVILCVPTYSMN